MLILGRGIDEVVRLIVPPSDKPQVIDIKVTEARRDKARLGFIADDSVRVHRLEVFEAIAKGELKQPEKPPVTPLIRIGDKLPGQ